MINRELLLAFAVATNAMFLAQVQAQTTPPASKVWRPGPGVASTVFRGSVKGYQQMQYVVDLRPGQILDATLDHQGSASLYHNITSPSGVTLFVGSMEGKRFQGAVREAGRYQVSVYLMRNDARRGRRVEFTLRLRRADPPTGRPPAAGQATSSFDCRPANGRVEETICSTPSPAALDARLDRVDGDALANSARWLAPKG